MLTQQQKLSAQAIVNIFETSRVLGDYGRVAVIRGDAGHLSYGRSMVSLASGNLARVVKEYCGSSHADPGLADALRPFLPKLGDEDFDEDSMLPLHQALKAAGSDPEMRRIQDAFLDAAFWSPASRSAARTGIATALGHAVVYDGFIQGSWGKMWNRTLEIYGPLEHTGERQWIGLYIGVRRKWLANHTLQALRPTVYRMDAFRDLIDSGNWDLALPFTVRGIRIDEESLGLA